MSSLVICAIIFQFWVKTIVHSGMLLRLPCIKNTLFFHRLVVWVFLGDWDCNRQGQQKISYSFANAQVLPQFLAKPSAFHCALTPQRQKGKAFKSRKCFFHLQKLRRLFSCNSKIPLWDTGLLQPWWVCLGQTWSDCAWLKKSSNSNGYKQIILLHYFFNMFICVLLSTAEVVICTEAESQNPLSFLAYNFPKLFSVWPNFSHMC